jgi:hypothetical protein
MESQERQKRKQECGQKADPHCPRLEESNITLQVGAMNGIWVGRGGEGRGREEMRSDKSIIKKERKKEVKTKEVKVKVKVTVKESGEKKCAVQCCPSCQALQAALMKWHGGIAAPGRVTGAAGREAGKQGSREAGKQGSREAGSTEAGKAR